MLFVCGSLGNGFSTSRNACKVCLYLDLFGPTKAGFVLGALGVGSCETHFGLDPEGWGNIQIRLDLGRVISGSSYIQSCYQFL